MCNQTILENYRNFLLYTRAFKATTAAYYLRYARKMLAENSLDELSFEELEKYLSMAKSRQRTLALFVRWLRDCGILNFDRFKIQSTQRVIDLVENYLRSLKLKGHTPRTCQSVRSNLNCFLGHLESKNLFYIHQVSKDVLAAFAQEANGHGYETSYCARLIVSLKRFFRFLVDAGELGHDPSVVLSVPKIPKGICRDIVSEKEIEKLESMIDLSRPTGIRDLCLIEVLYGTGIRRLEARRLRFEDIDFRRRTIFIPSGKGGKDRVVPMNKFAAAVLKKYITIARRRIITETGSTEKHTQGILFLNIYGRQMSDEGITRMIKRYGFQAGLNKKVTAHTLRHSCASHILQNGGDVRFIQAMLGHERLSTTQIYTQVAVEDLKTMVNKYHPYERRNV